MPEKMMPNESDLVQDPELARVMAHAEDPHRETYKHIYESDQDAVMAGEKTQKQMQLREQLEKMDLGLDADGYVKGVAGGHTFRVDKDGLGDIDGEVLNKEDGVKIFNKYIKLLEEVGIQYGNPNSKPSSAQEYGEKIIKENEARKATKLKEDQSAAEYNKGLGKVVDDVLGAI